VERHGAQWRFQIYVRGERIRRSFDTREEAERALQAIRDELERDAVADLARQLGRLTVADVVHAYYQRRSPHLEASTQSRYENVMHKYILPGIGQLDARALAATPLLLEDWLATVPWGSARKALEVLGPALRMAHDNGLIASNPVTKIRRPKRPDRRRKKEIPTPSEVEKLIIAAYEEDVWWGYFVELTVTLGTRRGETCGFRWEDFEFPGTGDATASSTSAGLWASATEVSTSSHPRAVKSVRSSHIRRSSSGSTPFATRPVGSFRGVRCVLVGTPTRSRSVPRRGG
jgi:integrase